MALNPLPLSTCVHLTPLPFRVDVINGWPLITYMSLYDPFLDEKPPFQNKVFLHNTIFSVRASNNTTVGGASIAVVLSVEFFFYYFFVISILAFLFSVRHLRTLVRSFRSYL